jgi:hypothetical protein
MPTKKLIIPDDHLEQMLKQWLDKQGGEPEFREPQCWSCGRAMEGKMWHVFFRKGEREAHICNQCAEPYMSEQIAQFDGGRIVWLVTPTAEQRKKMRDLMAKLGL